MKTIYLALALALFGALMFVVGRSTAKPAVRMEYVELPQRQTVITKSLTQKAEVKVITKRIVVAPDGTKTTDIKENTEVRYIDVAKTNDVTTVAGGIKKTDTPTIVTVDHGRASWGVGLLAGIDMQANGGRGKGTYGGQVSWRMAGPFWMSAWGTSTQQFGLGIGVVW